ncbi:uncharacterized protein LOC111680989 [Lucilia cuprina]|uniref:uncharacterized protein LOC111680989 n=1 Tax=Lucilia cuprina TaxID=7375 RepID=UPI001F05769F|nr:uncharacterized protein LOC111680989 [Lucilia cuprina]
MKLFLIIGLICGLIIANKAAVMQGNYADPKHPGKCVYHDMILSPGEHPYSKCGRMLCGETGWIVFHTCGAILPPDGHKLGKPIYPDAKYPKCCEKHYIPIEEENA